MPCQGVNPLGANIYTYDQDINMYTWFGNYEEIDVGSYEKETFMSLLNKLLKIKDQIQSTWLSFP